MPAMRAVASDTAYSTPPPMDQLRLTLLTALEMSKSSSSSMKLLLGPRTCPRDLVRKPRWSEGRTKYFR